MSIYELTQGYVNVRKLGSDFIDIVWRGLRIQPLDFIIYFTLML